MSCDFKRHLLLDQEPLMRSSATKGDLGSKTQIQSFMESVTTLLTALQ